MKPEGDRLLSAVILKQNWSKFPILIMKLYVLPATLLVVGVLGAVSHLVLAQSNNQPMSRQIKSNSKQANNSQAAPDRPSGGLFTQTKDGKPQVFPLKHTEVKAQVTGNLSRVEVTQTFENPFQNPLEAVYVFPLPDEAAVDDMEIKIGDRVIKGDIKKREEAKEIYERARQEGRTAGLLEQERDNIFTQSLANIKPGEKIEVTIRYTDSLKFEGGDYEFVFPMVVGHRYIPGKPIGGGDSNIVPDGSRINPPVVKPGTRSGHDISVTVDIAAGVPVSNIESTSHQIQVSNSGENVRVALKPEDNIPNKDLILRYRVATANTQATVLTQANDQGGHFASYLIPALEYRSNEIVPKDVVFLMDTSGSQSGDPIVKSQELMRRFIKGLNPNDTFTIIDFANSTKQLSAKPLANTAANRQKAIAYIDKLDANGGTELLNGIKTVLNFPAAPEGRLRSVVLITDGYIGNENEVIAEVQKQLKPGNRLYSFGVGSSVNRFILDRLAEVGRGTSQVIRQDEPTEAVAEKFFRQINNPVLTNIQVQWEGEGAAPELYPQAAPDLFANQPLVLFGKKKDRSNGFLKITGTAAGGKQYEQTLKVDFGNNSSPAIAQLWGRAKIKDLMNGMFGGETKSGVDAVTATALAYRLLSQYTAFVAVSEEVRVNPDGSRQKVEVPVEMPQGVSYTGVFGDAADQSANAPTTVGNLRSGYAAPPQSVMPNSPGGNRGRASTQPQPISKPKVPAREAEKLELQVPNNRLQIISADGLDPQAIASLTQLLQYVNLPAGSSGEIVLEFPVSNGRVGRIILDDTNSTLQESAIINEIKRAIATWQAPATASGTIRLKLRILP